MGRELWVVGCGSWVVVVGVIQISPVVGRKQNNYRLIGYEQTDIQKVHRSTVDAVYWQILSFEYLEE